MIVRKFAVPALLLAMLAGCQRQGEVTIGGITAVRSSCPIVGVPAGTGDITLFDPPASKDADALDVTAVITNVRSVCNDQVDPISTTITFDVLASRLRADGARDVVLPYYVAVVRGGTNVVSKHVGRVSVRFEAGQGRASTTGQATARVSREAATLPVEVRDEITRRRRAGDEAAAIDPLSRPEVRQAVLSATFEALVGFQLTEDQLKYNVTR